MANPGAILTERAWLEQCVRLVRQRAPSIGLREAIRCAEDMLHIWPDLPPYEAVSRYFERPPFEPTDWHVFELK